MSFLQPLLLAALPLAALPIVIHLINQRRYQTIRWGAMMFLLAAHRMSHGYARLRQWLIMALRVAAIAGLVFAIARPLSGGWLGLAAGRRADTTFILLDRSPSMLQAEVSGGPSKLEAGRRQLARTLETLGSSRWVLIEAGTNRPRELESPAALLDAPAAQPQSAASDLPAMLLAVRDFMRANSPGRTEVWICSDLRENDWNAESGRWKSLRDGFLEFPQGVRFHLLAYPGSAPENLAVRVASVRRQQTAEGAELLVSLRLRREGAGDAHTTIPLHFEIDGALSETTVEMAGASLELRDHRIPIERRQVRGWGRVSIPADLNPADNDDWFVYDDPPPRHAVVVAEDPQAGHALGLAASIAPDPAVKCSTEHVAPEKLGVVEWETTALLLWQGPLPRADAAAAIQAFLDRGGQVIFFPPANPDPSEFQGVRWTAWTAPGAETPVESWRGDQDLLAQTQSGAALPVGQLQVRRHCGLAGELTPLATLKGGLPLLARVSTSAGGLYFCATTPAARDSSLAAGGVVLYVLVQRALAEGARPLGNTRSVAAGEILGGGSASWNRVAGGGESLSTEYALHGGIYRADDRLIAVSRPPAEDLAPVLAAARLAELFGGLDFVRVDDRAGSAGGLIQEIWRMFLVAMMVAMVVEAGLCLPRLRRPGGAS